MRVDKKIYLLKNLYIDIHELCIVNFFNNAKNSDAVVFREIIGKCEGVLNSIQKSINFYPSLDIKEEDILDITTRCDEWSKKTVDEALAVAYGGKDVENVSNSKGRQSQIEQLKQIEKMKKEYGKVIEENTQLSLNDIEVMFNEVLALLKKNVTISEIIEQVGQIFKKYGLRFNL